MIIELKTSSLTSEQHCIDLFERGYQRAVKQKRNLVIVYLGLAYVFPPPLNEEYRIARWKRFYEEVYLARKSALV